VAVRARCGVAATAFGANFLPGKRVSDIKHTTDIGERERQRDAAACIRSH
jgi:hypothetical protein